MATPNAELAYKVLDQIDAHPKQWNQDIWIGQGDCGTVGCFAGWACLLSGDQPDFGDYPQHTARLTNGWIVSERAEELLGVNRYVEGTDYETDLFSEFNTREDLGRMVEELFGPRPAVTE